MEDVLLICLLSAFFVIGYFQMNKVDDSLKKAVKRKNILIVYDDQYRHVKDYENENIVCLQKQELWDLSQPYTLVVICTKDDHYNLLLNYRIQNSTRDCDVYAFCFEKEYMNLYHKEQIHILHHKDDLKGLIGFYEKNMETANKC